MKDILSWFRNGLLSAFFMICFHNGKAQAPIDEKVPKVVSQCYRSRGFSFVSLYCGYNKVIQIQQSFHGAHKNQAIDHCGLLEGDCVSDTTNHYDWSKCESRHSCVQSINKLSMPECQDEMVYLQVQYSCVEGTALTIPSSVKTTPSSPAPSRQTTKEEQEQLSGEILNICTNFTGFTSRATIVNPGYPQYYSSDTECRCIVKGLPETKVAVTYQDLALVMRSGQCVDWLLLQSLGFKNSAAVTCGQMGSSQKTLMAKGNWLLLHFHTAHLESGQHIGMLDMEGKVKRGMRGFKVMVTTKPDDVFEIQCHATSPEILSNLKYNSKYDVNGNKLLPASDLNELAANSACGRYSTGFIPLTLLVHYTLICGIIVDGISNLPIMFLLKCTM